MSVVAISESMGSLGVEIGAAVAAALGYDFAERDIITKTADRFGEDVARLSHAAEERPGLLERLNAAQRRFAHYVEATVHEMAARDNIVLAGLASTIILARAPHTLRVRITASEARRAQRVAQARGITPTGALEHVREADRERAGRVRFLYHVHWEDVLLYDLVINTDRLETEEGARLVRQALDTERFRSTDASRRALRDGSVVVQVRAVLMADPVTRNRAITVDCTDGVVSLGGRIEEWPVRDAAAQAVARIPGVREIRYLEPPTIEGPRGQGPSEHLHGESRRWGGFGPS